MHGIFRHKLGMRLWPFSRSEPIETKAPSGTSVPADWMFELFGGGLVADYAVTGQQALEVPAVSSAISLISGSIASLGIMVEKRDGDAWIAAPDHPIARLLEDAPNDWSDTYTLVRNLVASALTCNEGGLAFANKRDGEVVEVIHYAQGSFTVDYSTDGRLEPSYRIGNRPVGADDVIHLRGPFTKCPLSLAAGAIGVAHKMERHAGSFFAKGAVPSIVLLMKKAIGEKGAMAMLKGWRKAFGGPADSGKTAVLWDDASVQQLAMKAVDAQFLETWRHAINEIGRHFRVPPGALYDFERQTWSNMESAQKEWLAGLEFWLRPLEGAMRRALFSIDDRADHRIRFDRDDFTAVDLTARATAIASLIACRVLSPDDGRDWLGMPKRPDGKGGEFANPHTGSNQPGAAAPQLPSPNPEPTE